jgi:hypothetical protein
MVNRKKINKMSSEETKQASSVEKTTSDLCSKILQSELASDYREFISSVTEFIRGVDQNTVDPKYIVSDSDTGKGITCLEFVEQRCMNLVLRMYNLTISNPGSTPPEFDTLRNFMNELAKRRNSKNIQDMNMINSLDILAIEKLIFSIERVADLSFYVLGTSTNHNVTPLYQQALELLKECCIQFIKIIDMDNKESPNPNIAELKKHIKKTLFATVAKLGTISEDDGKSMFQKIIGYPWGAEYAKAKGYQVGGKGVNYNSLKKKSKNRSNRRIRRITLKRRSILKRRSKKMYNSGNKKNKK